MNYATVRERVGHITPDRKSNSKSNSNSNSKSNRRVYYEKLAEEKKLLVFLLYLTMYYC